MVETNNSAHQLIKKRRKKWSEIFSKKSVNVRKSSHIFSSSAFYLFIQDFFAFVNVALILWHKLHTTLLQINTISYFSSFRFISLLILSKHTIVFSNNSMKYDGVCACVFLQLLYPSILLL